jgi:hypothetical protein
VCGVRLHCVCMNVYILLVKAIRDRKKRIIGKKERHKIYIHTYYNGSEWEKKRKEITQCMNKQRAYNDCL